VLGRADNCTLRRRVYTENFQEHRANEALSAGAETNLGRTCECWRPHGYDWIHTYTLDKETERDMILIRNWELHGNVVNVKVDYLDNIACCLLYTRWPKKVSCHRIIIKYHQNLSTVKWVIKCMADWKYLDKVFENLRKKFQIFCLNLPALPLLFTNRPYRVAQNVSHYQIIKHSVTKACQWDYISLCS